MFVWFLASVSACQGNATVRDNTTLVAAVTNSSPSAPCRILLNANEIALAAPLNIFRSVQLISVTTDRTILRAVPVRTHRVLNLSKGDIVLNGIVVADGGALNPRRPDACPDACGGGIYINGANVTLLDSIVANNTAGVRAPPAAPRTPAVATRPRPVPAPRLTSECTCGCACHRRRLMVVGLPTATAT